MYKPLEPNWCNLCPFFGSTGTIIENHLLNVPYVFTEHIDKITALTVNVKTDYKYIVEFFLIRLVT